MSEEAAEVGGGKCWEDEAVKRKFGWAGHVLRRPDNRPAKLALYGWQRQSRRARPGAPRRRWTLTFEELLGEGWQENAQDRQGWRNWADEAVLFQRSFYRSA